MFINNNNHKDKMGSNSKSTGSKPKSTSNVKVTTPKSTSNSKVTTPKNTSNTKVTTPKNTTNQKTTTPKNTSNNKVTTPKNTTNQKTTTPKNTTNQKTTTPKNTTNQKTTTPKNTTNQKTTTPKNTTNQKTTTPSNTTNQKTTTPKNTTNVKVTTPSNTTNQKTTTPSNNVINKKDPWLPERGSAEESAVNGITYWYATKNATAVDYQIAKCMLALAQLRNSITSLGKVVQEYVNIPGKWFDANSEAFAQWWNAGTGHVLRVQEDGGLKLDEEDTLGGLKEIYSKCTALFWIVISRQLYVVTNTKFPKQRDRFSTQIRNIYNYGGHLEYASMSTKEEKAWAELNAKLLDLDELFLWENLHTLTVNKAGGTNVGELVLFIGKMQQQYERVNEKLSAFLEEVDKIRNDQTSKMYFGFSPNANMHEAAQELRVFINFNATSFEETMKAVLSGYHRLVEHKLNDFLNTDYNVK